MTGHEHAPRLALRREDAAAALGISVDTFDAHVRAHVRVVRLGALRLYPIAALAAFLDEQASAPQDEIAAHRTAA